MTNPIFEQRSVWWDVLCNVTTGDVVYSPAYAEELKNVDMEHANALDNAFINEVINGVKARNGEEWTRCMFRVTIASHPSHIE